MTTILAVVMSAALLGLVGFQPEPGRDARRPSELLAAMRAAGLRRCALGALAAAAGFALMLLAELLRVVRVVVDLTAKAAAWSAAYIETLWADSQARRTSTILEVAP